MIEGLTAAVSVLIFLKFDVSLEWAAYFPFCCALIVLAFIDLDHRILPDAITLNGLWIGVVLSFVLFLPGPFIGKVLQYAGVSFPSARLVSVVSSVLGAIVGGGILWAVGEVYFRVRGVEGMGFGDVKMMAMVGAFIGAPRAMLTIMVGSLIGSVAGLLMMRFSGTDKEYELAFGTYLSIAAIGSLLYGDELLRMYYNWMALS